ncbi:hypothetical protein F8M41_008455 [Gigaspora margarita]|uniref:Uncharacterized protein n=1 Tax=Gigaspora margarita TaxID=4874 RepID=A0A8H4EQX4_GIGMA|nr:hypothetical protein F8M41_008455 [Gigaspora margarita]
MKTSVYKFNCEMFRQKLEDLANKYPIPLDAPQLLRDKTLDLDGLKSLRIPDFNNVSESDADEIIAEDDNILPLENNVSTERVNPNELIINPNELIDPYSPIKKIFKGFEVAVKYSKRLQTELSKLDIAVHSSFLCSRKD